MNTSTFNAASTTDEVLAGVDLRGKRILVTGVSAGLGASRPPVPSPHTAPHVTGSGARLG